MESLIDFEIKSFENVWEYDEFKFDSQISKSWKLFLLSQGLMTE